MSIKTNYTDQIKKEGYCVIPQVFTSNQINQLLTLVKNTYERTKDEISQDTPEVFLDKNLKKQMDEKNLA